MVSVSRHVLDARNLLCPMPVIRTQQKAATLAIGDVLQVRCTDPGALADIPAWCRVHGHELLDAQTHGDELVITLRIAEPSRTGC